MSLNQHQTKSNSSHLEVTPSKISQIPGAHFELLLLENSPKSNDAVLRLPNAKGSVSNTVAVFRDLSAFRSEKLSEAIAGDNLDRTLTVIEQTCCAINSSDGRLLSSFGTKPYEVASRIADAYYESLSRQELTQMICVEEAWRDVYWVTAPPLHLISSTLLRLQEHYEGPKFRGKQFSKDDYIRWYKSQTEDADFTYYSDFLGFNFPSSVVDSFKSNGFQPYSKTEKTLLSQLPRDGKQFYVIGTKTRQSTNMIAHELAHALFYLDSDYRIAVKRVLRDIDTTLLEKQLLSQDYVKAVYVDECNAYILDGLDYLASAGVTGQQYEGAYKQLKELFDQAKKQAVL